MRTDVALQKPDGGVRGAVRGIAVGGRFQQGSSQPDHQNVLKTKGRLRNGRPHSPSVDGLGSKRQGFVN